MGQREVKGSGGCCSSINTSCFKAGNVAMGSQGSAALPFRLRLELNLSLWKGKTHIAVVQTQHWRWFLQEVLQSWRAHWL